MGRLLGTVVPVWALALATFVLAAGCSCDSGLAGRGNCTRDRDCTSGVCRGGRCQASTIDTGLVDARPTSSCSSTPPVPATEVCNGVDDDCDGDVDDGVLSTCGDCVPECEGEHLGPRGIPFDPIGHTDDSESESVGLDEEGALVLDTERIETAFIWIANTGEGTVSKVDTRTFTEVARYRTGPLDGAANDPSRTSINSLGDAYVANRAGRSVTKISVLGADCPDTNGDGTVRTSTGPTDVLPWGQDDCVLWNTSLPDGGILRALAAQDTTGLDGALQTAVWVGGWESVVWKLDGETGAIEVRTPSPTPNYGFALDRSGNLWISGRSAQMLGRIDTTRCTDTLTCDVPACAEDTCVKQQIPIPGALEPYGVTVDAAQRVWTANYGSQTVARYDPMAPAGSRWTITNVGADCHGIAADGAGWIWAAGFDTGIIRLDSNTPSMFAVVPGTGGRVSKGMAIDFDGRLWSINQTAEDATVVTPGPTLTDQTVMTEVVPALVAPYTYSDMTGQQLRLATDPRGYWRRPFEGCAEDEVTNWDELRFEADVPTGTHLAFRIRTAPTRAELSTAVWLAAGRVPPTVSPISIDDILTAASIEPQRWLEVEVQLEALRESATIVISPRVRSVTVTRTCGTIVG